MFGIAKGFGLQERVAAQILEKMKGQEEVANRVIAFSNSLLDKTSGGVIAGVGVIFLFWTIISLLSNIESSFNDIWGVVKPRTFGRKVSRLSGNNARLPDSIGSSRRDDYFSQQPD